jgi:TRAP-type C4-dicarboxylate transport system substrate-binding protein
VHLKHTQAYCRRVAVAIAVGAAMMATAARAEDVVLRYNLYLPVGHWSQQEGLFPYFEQIAEVTEGRVTVEVSAAPLAPPNRNYQAAVDGIADLVWGPHGYTPGAFPLSEMVEFPFLTTDVGAASAAYWRVWKAHFEPTGMQSDVVTLAMHVTAGGNIHMRGDPVMSTADLAGQRIRVPTALTGRVLQNIGAVPVSAPLTELREMLSRGIVDGVAISDEFVTGMRVEEHIEGVTYIPGGLFSSSAFIGVNRAVWDRISPDDQAAIMAISGEVISRRMGELWQQYDEEARALFRENLGDNYAEAPEALLDELRPVFDQAWDEWLAAAEAEGVDGEVAAAFYRAQIDELSGAN